MQRGGPPAQEEAERGEATRPLLRDTIAQQRARLPETTRRPLHRREDLVDRGGVRVPDVGEG